MPESISSKIRVRRRRLGTPPDSRDAGLDRGFEGEHDAR
jgi:hypothetical protein